jgi:hypothetical protein
MADDNLETLMNARAALARKRLTLAQTIATDESIPDAAIKGLIELQQAVEVIDLAIDELEEAELEDALDDGDE